MSELKVNKVSPVTGTELTLGDSGDTIDLSTTTVTLPANSVDSDQYVNASIDNEHLADDAVNSDELAAGAVDLAHMSATGTPSASNFLRGDNSWQEAGGGAWNFIGTAVASNSASLTITGLDTSVYESFAIRLTNLVGASDGQALWVRLGDSGGIDSGGSDYNWVGVKNRAGSTSPAGGGSASIGQIIIDTSLGTGTGESVSCTMWLSAASATDYPNLTYHSLAYSSVPDSMCNTGGGSRMAAIDVTQVQILASSGNLTSGRMTVWGVAHA